MEIEAWILSQTYIEQLRFLKQETDALYKMYNERNKAFKKSNGRLEFKTAESTSLMYANSNLWLKDYNEKLEMVKKITAIISPVIQL